PALRPVLVGVGQAVGQRVGKRVEKVHAAGRGGEAVWLGAVAGEVPARDGNRPETAAATILPLSTSGNQRPLNRPGVVSTRSGFSWGALGWNSGQFQA